MKEIPFRNLDTSRLLLRQLEHSDASALFRLHSHDDHNRYVDREIPKKPEDSLAFIKKINRGIREMKWYYWGIGLVRDPVVIGTICLWNFSSDRLGAEVGFALYPDFQGNGYMQEALEQVLAFGFGPLRLEQISGYTHPENAKSIALLKKTGFILEKVIPVKLHTDEHKTQKMNVFIKHNTA